MDSTKETIPVRMNFDQHETIRKAANKQDVPFQYMLRRVIRTGINVMRLGEKK